MTKAIVYTSTTGNTEMMSGAFEKGAKRSDADVLFITADKASAVEVLPADIIILGSPAMGAETLEDSMETFFCAQEGKLMDIATKKKFPAFYRTCCMF
jgi:flavodoxin I